MEQPEQSTAQQRIQQAQEALAAIAKTLPAGAQLGLPPTIEVDARWSAIFKLGVQRGFWTEAEVLAETNEFLALSLEACVEHARNIHSEIRRQMILAPPISNGAQR